MELLLKPMLLMLKQLNLLALESGYLFYHKLLLKAGECYHCHTGRCPVGVATQDPKLRARLNPDDAALRVYNYLHSMTLEAQLLARACGKTNIHSLEPEDLAALTLSLIHI